MKSPNTTDPPWSAIGVLTTTLLNVTLPAVQVVDVPPPKRLKLTSPPRVCVAGVSRQAAPNAGNPINGVAAVMQAAASAALSFDFIVKPLSTNHRSRQQHGSYKAPFIECVFWTNAGLRSAR